MSQGAVQTRPSPHVRKKRLRRRDEILHSALQTFRENGYHGTTLGEIASRLGLQKTAIYHYFPDKEALLYECHRRSLGELELALAEATRGSGKPSERLARVVREHVRVMTETLEGSPLAFEVQALSPEHQAEVVTRRDAYEKTLRGLIAAGVEQGEFRPVDPKVVTFAILGAINWIARWYQPAGGLQAPELGAEFAEYLVGGLVQRKESA